MDRPCIHLQEALGRRSPTLPRTFGCEECLALGSDWVELRMCLACGHVGCCDSSLHRHATAHFLETGHPTMKSFEPDGDWAWCYVDEQMATIPRFPVEAPEHHIDAPQL